MELGSKQLFALLLLVPLFFSVRQPLLHLLVDGTNAKFLVLLPLLLQLLELATTEGIEAGRFWDWLQKLRTLLEPQRELAQLLLFLLLSLLVQGLPSGGMAPSGKTHGALLQAQHHQTCGCNRSLMLSLLLVLSLVCSSLSLLLLRVRRSSCRSCCCCGCSFSLSPRACSETKPS